MFENLNDYPVDPIMIGTDYFAQDPRREKLNLTVGVYQDEHGRTPILQAVKRAEQILVETQTSKSYLAPTGDPEYCKLLGSDILGTTFGDDWVAAQTFGGAGALRLMDDLVAQLPERPTVWLQTPTYGDYIPILRAASAKYQTISYYNRMKSEIMFDQMLDHLGCAKTGDLF